MCVFSLNPSLMSVFLGQSDSKIAYVTYLFRKRLDIKSAVFQNQPNKRNGSICAKKSTFCLHYDFMVT